MCGSKSMIMRKLLIYTAAALLLLSCSRDRDTLSGTGEKTPLKVGLALQAGGGSAATKAADMDFATGDKFDAYLRHVTWNGAMDGDRTNVEADQAPQLVTFTKGSTPMGEYTDDDITPIGTGVALGLTSSNTKIATDFAPDHALYWDDFSNSASAATDLRTADHYLESFYGYCYNGSPAYGQTGSHITTALDQEHGTLGWTVATNQSTGFQTSDLLWSAEQKPVAYAHAKDRAGLVIPFTHALSKVTVVVVCDTDYGFSASKDNFTGSSLVLKNMNTVCALTAPTATVTASGTPADITMRPTSVSNVKRSFSAIVARTAFSDNQEFAAINLVDGNNYKIVLSDAVMRTSDPDDDDWASKLNGYTEGTKSGTTLPGVHYMITVTIRKQEITVAATIQDWEDVTAEGVGIINFNNDITTIGNLDVQTLKDNGFDIYQSANVNPQAYNKVTSYSFTGEPKKWTRTNEIYWPNGADRFYFRALSPKDATTDMAFGSDVLWATTQAHKGPNPETPALTYAEGDPIAPRTGDVPLVFYHPMAKVTVNLVDANKDTPLPDGVEADDYDNPLNPRLNLTGATVRVTNMSDAGTIELHEGNITPDETVDEIQIATNEAKTSINIPQEITDDTKMIVTLSNGATYSLQLNTCIGADEAAITEWERGKHYTYTITLSKEAITFRAMIKDWIETSGGGNANLEWD